MKRICVLCVVAILMGACSGLGEGVNNAIEKGKEVANVTKERVEKALRKKPEQSGDPEDGTDSAASKDAYQRNLQVYSGENRTEGYIIEGTLYGATLAAIDACGIDLLINTKQCLENAGKNMLVGLTAGAISGYLVATQEEKNRLKAEELQSDIDKARIELAEAIVATEAAQKLTSQRRAELDRLRRDATSNENAKIALEQELKDARGDLESMRKSSIRMNEQIVRIEADREKEANRANRDEFDSTIRELKDQREELDSQIDILDGAVAGTTV